MSLATGTCCDLAWNCESSTLAWAAESTEPALTQQVSDPPQGPAASLPDSTSLHLGAFPDTAPFAPSEPQHQGILFIMVLIHQLSTSREHQIPLSPLIVSHTKWYAAKGCGLALLTDVNVHGVGPMLSVTVGGTAEVRARVTDLGVGNLGRSKIKSHYLWSKSEAPCQDLPQALVFME